MKAQNRTIPEWFQHVESGQLKLPRFQRFEAWGHNEIAHLLEAVLRGLPVGAVLILNVGDKEPFEGRPVSGVKDIGVRCTEHLLDGQQRLTALWKGFHDRYEDRTYLVYFENDEEDDSRRLPRVEGIARWKRDEKPYPLWVDKPKDVYGRGYFPLHLLRLGEIREETHDWCDEVAENDLQKSREIGDQISKLREKILAFNMPYLALPSDTSQDIALDVFIKMNTSSVKLTAFDIIVAQLEAKAGQSLHQLVQNLITQVPDVEAYEIPQNLIMRSAAMREDRPPTQASFHRLNLQKLADEWQQLVAGIKWAIQILEEEGIFDERRLPTTVILPVLAALHACFPSKLDARGRARGLVRSYVWRAFLTRRYDRTATSRALQDLRELSSAIKSGITERTAPIFNEEEHPLPSVDELMQTGWPYRKDTLARGILALSLKGGARDFADDQIVTRQHLHQREYHHLFPRSLLSDDEKLHPDYALNCALVTWNTNRDIAAKEPIRYLEERTTRASLGENEVRRRLHSHLVPYDELAVGGYDNIPDAKDRSTKIARDYEAFLRKRASMMSEAMKILCQGELWPST